MRPAGRAMEAHDAKRRDRFAAARFADQGDDLALPHLVGDALDGAHDSARGDEMHVKIGDVEQRRAIGRRRHTARRVA